MTYDELVEKAESSLFIIGEAGVNHNGSIESAKALVDVAIEAGCDAVKFQTWITEKVYSRELSVKPEYQRRTTGDDESAFDTIKNLELSFSGLVELKAYCDARGIAFFSTPDEIDSAIFLVQLGVPLMKSASQDVTNIPFLRYLGGLSIPLIFSTGASTREELDDAVDALRQAGAHFVMLHCVSAYPAPLEQLNLRLIPALGERYGVHVGFSDHTIGVEAASAALALGSRIFEKHFTLSREQEGPDHQASATPDDLRLYVQHLRALYVGLGDGVKRLMPCEIDNRNAFRRFLVTARAISKGERVTAEDFVFKKTTSGIEPSELERIVGAVTVTDLPEDAPLRWEHLEARRPS